MTAWLAEKWEAMQRRPLAFMLAVVGFLVFVLVFTGNVSIITHVTHRPFGTPNPCDNLTTKQCAEKLLASLPPKERKHVITVVIKKTKARARAHPRNGHSSAGRRGSPGGSPGSRRPGGTPPGSSPGSSSPQAPGGGIPSPNPPSGGGTGSGGGGPGNSPTPPSRPVIHTPGVQIGPITVPPIDVPCTPTPLTNCN